MKKMSKAKKHEEFDWPFEISGFGGDYEDACRRMTVAAVEWLRKHPDDVKSWHAAEVKYKKDNPNSRCFPPKIYPNSKDEFENAVVAVCEDCTGTMFGAAISHAKAIVAKGWDKYVDSVIKYRKQK